MGDVIDFRARSKGKAGQAAKNTQNNDASVVDISEIRTEVLNQDRRQVKRTIFDGIYSCSCCGAWHGTDESLSL